MKNDPFFPRDPPPREKLVIFAKMPKIMPNIKIRAGLLFYKKGTKFPKKLFGQSCHIFTLGVQGVSPAPFLAVTSDN